MKTLAIDFGERRIGLAISDPDGRIAFPLTTLLRTSDRQVIEEIRAVIEDENVEQLVVGEPINVDGSRGPAAERASRFARKLEAAAGKPTRLISETLTTVEAAERLRAAGVDLRRHRERLDSVSAQILLEEALAQ